MVAARPRGVRVQVYGLLVVMTVLFREVPVVQSRGERKIHLRFHTGDLVSAHTHTHTLYLPPALLYSLPPHTMQAMLLPMMKASGGQPISYIRQTVFVPRGTHPQPIRVIPMPGRLQHGFRPVLTSPVSHASSSSGLPLTHSLRVHIPAGSVSSAGHTSGSSSRPGQGQGQGQGHLLRGHTVPMLYHQVPASFIMVPPKPSPAPANPAPQQAQPTPRSPPPPPPALIPMSVIAIGSPKLAPLRVAPSQDELKKSKGCRAFVKGRGEELADGDCFLEEYEKGYNEEQSKKTFFGDENSDVNTEKEGERQSRRYKNQHEFEHVPKVKHEWIEAPGGRHHLLRTQIGKSRLVPHSERLVGSAPSPPGPQSSKPATVTLIRLPPGSAKLLVRPAAPSKEGAKRTRGRDSDEADDSWGEDDNESKPRKLTQHLGKVLNEEDPDINPVEQSNSAGLVEVFKQSARSVPSNKHVIRPIWMEAFRPINFKKVEDDDFDGEETLTKPLRIAKVTATVAETRMTSALTDGDEEDGWTNGFNDEEFHQEPEKSDKKNEFNVDFDEEMKAIREDDEDDEGEGQKQADSSNIRDSFAMVKGKGRAEKMLNRSRVGPLNTDHDLDSPRLSAILASGGHVFKPPTPPTPHPAAFGMKDPDRLEAGRKSPIVVEFGHELSGYKVTQEKEQKKWRR